MKTETFYNALAPFYDRLGKTVDYKEWATYLESQFSVHYAGKVTSVLDLGCGTGKLTCELSARGYDMIGVDISPEMLSKARERAEKEKLQDRILYLCQDLSSFELYGTVEAVVSSLDVINHVTDLKKLRACFHWVHNYLVPNGLFIFDVHTPYQFENIYGENVYTLENDGVFCTWENRYRKKTGLCDFYITLFTEKKNGLWEREDIDGKERLYSLNALTRLLKEEEMEILDVSAGFHGEKQEKDTQRLFITARAIKENT